MKQYLEVGKIVGTHGIKGEVRVQPWADSGDFLTSFSRMYFENGGTEIKIKAARVHKNVVVMRLEGVNSVSEADVLRGRVLFINRDDAELPEGRYFIDDLIGLKIVEDSSGREYGILENISSMPANEVYHVRGANGKEYLIPAVDSVIAHTDIAGGEIRINALKGMFDDEN